MSFSASYSDFRLFKGIKLKLKNSQVFLYLKGKIFY